MSCYHIWMLVFTGGTAVGTIGLAIFAYRQIHHVTEEQQRRRKSEIIEFANSASAWKLIDADNDKDFRDSSQVMTATSMIISTKANQVLEISRTGHIIYNTLSEAKNGLIKSMVEKLLKELASLYSALSELQNKIDFSKTMLTPEFITQLDKVGIQMDIVHNAGEALFDEVAKRREI
jgi:hypothetical protein